MTWSTDSIVLVNFGDLIIQLLVARQVSPERIVLISQRQLSFLLGLFDLVDPLPGEEQRRLHVVLVAQRARHREAQSLVTDVAPTSVSARHLLIDCPCYL